MKSEEKKKKFYFLVIGVLSFVVAFLFLSIILLSFLLVTNDGSYCGVDEEELIEYQFFRFSTSSKEKNHGFVTLSKDFLIPEEGFVQVEESSITMYSDIGSEEYACTGTCFCADNEQRRFVSSGQRSKSLLLSKGITTLVAAVTSLVAYEVAKDRMKEECGKQFLTECDVDSIIAEVDVCHMFEIFERKTSKDKEEEEKSLLPDEIPPEFEFRYGSKQFMCKGKCVYSAENLEFSFADMFYRGYGYKYKCGNLKLESMVIVGGQYNQMVGNVVAREKFLEKLLKDYCKTNGMLDHPAQGQKLMCKEPHLRRVKCRFITHQNKEEMNL